jgi:stage II sporulation protein P
LNNPVIFGATRKLKEVKMLHKKTLYFKLLAALTALAASPVIATAAAGSGKGISDIVSAVSRKDVVPVMSGSFTLDFQRSVQSNAKAGISADETDSIIEITEIAPPDNLTEETDETTVPAESSADDGSEENPLPADTTPSDSSDDSNQNGEQPEDLPPVFGDESAAAVISRNIADTNEDLSVFTAEDGVIRKVSYQPIVGTDYIDLAGGGQVWNLTAIDPTEIAAQSKLPPSMTFLGDGSPEVLIVHTHTTEAFQPDSGDTYDQSYEARCFDPTQSIVAVGAAIAEQLAAAGFGVIHDGTIHDSPAYEDAYARSAEVIRQTIAEYPTVKVVLDIHRDAISYDGGLIAPVVNVNGRDAAQVMIISAVDSPEYPVPNFWQNFRFASLLQQGFESNAPGITSPILFDYCQYNQQITPGSLLIEVGAHGNSLEQAVYAGEIVGESVAEVLKELRG